MGVAVTAVAGVLTNLGMSAGLSQLLAGAAVRLAGSMIIGKLTKSRRPRGPADKGRDLSYPEDLVPYRFAYGETVIQGSPAPWRVKGSVLYGCILLNSRPSQAITQILLDARPVALSGSLTDFAGAGAVATNAPFAGKATFWAGLGGQTQPPAQILAEAPEHFQASDAWRGRTVLWCRLVDDDPDERAERWPAAPPEVKVGGRWSKLWDPRVAGQSADDPSGWTWSANQALVALDALMRNPVRPWRAENLLLQSFIEGANVAAQAAARRSGGPEARYEAHGLVVWTDAELLDQLAPIFEAGASRPLRVGGRLGLVPGAMRESVLTVGDVLDDDGMAFRRWAPSSELPTSMRVRYVNRDRGYEMAELMPWPIPGALAEDGGLDRPEDLDLTFVASPTQAMRIRKIVGLRLRQQRKITAVLPPTAYDAVGGSIVTFELPEPYGRMSGLYEVQSAQPVVTPAPGEGVHLAVPVEAIEHPAAIYAYDPAVDEEDIFVEAPFVPGAAVLQPPVPDVAVTGQSAALQYGDTRMPQIIWRFAPSPSASVTAYEWRLVQVGPGTIVQRGSVPTKPGTAFDIRTPAEHGVSYRMEIWSRGTEVRSRSAQVATAPVMALGPTVDLDAPTPAGVAAETMRLRPTFVAPDSDDATGLQLYMGSSPDIASANPFGSALTTPPGTSRTWSVGVPSGATRYFWARATGQFDSVSPLSASQTGTAA